MAHALIVSGGIYHPFAETSAALAGILDRAGFSSRTTEDIEAGLAGLATERADLLVVNCLRWTMRQNEKYTPFRARWALSPSAEARAALSSHAARGGGVLGLHTAAICFDDWPEWRDILGAAWVWGRSHHPPIGPVTARPRGDDALVRGLAPFTVQDELYSDLDIAPDARIVMEASLPGEAPQPVAILREGTGGRAAYLALGHDATSIAEPAHAALIARAAVWVARRPVRASGENAA